MPPPLHPDARPRAVRLGGRGRLILRGRGGSRHRPTVPGGAGWRLYV